MNSDESHKPEKIALFIVIIIIMIIVYFISPKETTSTDPDNTAQPPTQPPEIVMEISPVSITSASYEMDFLGGVQFYFEIRNNTDKQIKYITLQWECQNAVLDPVYDEITGKSTLRYRMVGPLDAGDVKRYSTSSTSKFYNSTFANLSYKDIVVEFMDGEIVEVRNNKHYDIIKYSSLNFPSLPYSIYDNNGELLYEITNIEYTFKDNNSSSYSGDGKRIKNDLDIEIKAKYYGYGMQGKLQLNLIDLNGNIIYKRTITSTLKTDDNPVSFSAHHIYDCIIPGDSYDIELSIVNN